MSGAAGLPSGAWVNPLLREPSADPFVLAHAGAWWAFCTGLAPDGRAFPIFHSDDLVHWVRRAGAMTTLPEPVPEYWAPEVFLCAGVFHLYYSAGDGLNRMVVRVATAEAPEGPYEDRGVVLTREPFAIDAHVFEDEDGSRWLFYATDFPDAPHAGTGIVRDRMLDPFRLEGDPRPVALPRYDWHVFDPCRAEKGGLRWHTVEGPFVLKRKGRYYLMYSGGNWSNPSYGIGYATTTDLAGGAEWEQPCDGVAVPPILKTRTRSVIGPGHNSVVRGPDARELWCVYHRWDPGGGTRVLSMDRMDWVGDRLVVFGPTETPQPPPHAPVVSGFPAPPWRFEGGVWDVSGAGVAAVAAVATGRGGETPASACCPAGGPFVAEFTVRVAPAAENDRSGPGWCAAALRCSDERRVLPIPADGLDHRVRIETMGCEGAFHLDGRLVWRGVLPCCAEAVNLEARSVRARLSGFVLSPGWEEEFRGGAAGLVRRGWQVPPGDWRVAREDGSPERRLFVRAPASTAWQLLRDEGADAFVLAVSARLLQEQEEGGGWGIRVEPESGPDSGDGASWILRRSGAAWVLAGPRGAITLPRDFDPARWQQLQWHYAKPRATIRWNMETLGEFAMPFHPARVGIVCRAAVAAFDLVRLTVLPEKGARHLFRDGASATAGTRRDGGR